MRNLKIALWTFGQLGKLFAAGIPILAAVIGVVCLHDKR
jgi:hypothetical protein